MRLVFISLLTGLLSGWACAQPDGAAIYRSRCTACHQVGAVGAPGLAPPLAGNIGRHAVSQEGREYLTRVVLHGMSGSIVVDGIRYSSAMPAQSTLSDADVANVLTYLLKDIEQLDDLDWLAPEYVAAVRLMGGSPSETYKLRSRLPAISK